MRATEIQQRSLPETPTPPPAPQQQNDRMPSRSASMVTTQEPDACSVLTEPYDEPTDEEQRRCFSSLREAINRAGADEMRAILLNMTDTLENGLRPSEHQSYYNWPGNGLN